MKTIFAILILIYSQIAIAADVPPGFEIQDLQGSTVHYSGTASTVEANIPTVADKVISEVFFKCDFQTPNTKKCLISFDGGTGWLTLDVGEMIGWSQKGKRTQIKVKANTTGVTYQAIVNYETY